MGAYQIQWVSFSVSVSMESAVRLKSFSSCYLLALTIWWTYCVLSGAMTFKEIDFFSPGFSILQITSHNYKTSLSETAVHRLQWM